MRGTLFLIAFSALSLSGCAGEQGLTGAAPGTQTTVVQPPASQGSSDRVVYDRALSDSALFQQSHVRPLTPLAYPVSALTLSSNTSWADGKEGKSVTIANPYGVWISVEPELQKICRTFPRDQIHQRLHQLLGLKPYTEADAKERFIRYSVKKQNNGPAGIGVFRPCPNPDPGQTQCGNQITATPAQSAFVSWFANQMVFSYKTGPEMKDTGYPWTRLGYTYDWDPKASDIRGVQEYIVPDKTVVTVTAIVSPDAYCAAN